MDVETAIAYRRDLERVMAKGSHTQRKRFIRSWGQEIKLAPERLEVQITYQIPEPVMNSLVARGLVKTLTGE